jgi:hypothetical protein
VYALARPIAGTGHLLFIEKPAATLAVLEAFLAGGETSTAGERSGPGCASA